MFAANSFAADSLHIFSAKKGLIDLRNANPDQKEINLTGEWAFYWNQILSPDSLQYAQPEYISFPSLWNNTEFKGKKLPAQGCATYALTVLLPHTREPLAFKIPDVYSAHCLYVNGKVFSKNGKVATNAADEKPWWSNEVRAIPNDLDTLNIVWQVSNFSHSKGGAKETLTIGNKQQIIHGHDQTTAFDFLLTGCLFMGGLFFFGLYMFGRYDKTLLFFSLFSMIFSYRIVGADPYSLHPFIEGTSWFLCTRFEYLSLYLSELLFGLYVRSLYPQDAHKKIFTAIYIILGLFIASVLVLPPIIFTSFIDAFLIFSFLNIGYVLYIFINAVLRKRTGAVYSLAGAIVIMCVFLYTGLAYLNQFKVNQLLVMCGYILFFFLQSLILSYRFAHNLKKAKRQAERALLAKSQFLSTMSHEIRTPLNAVIGLTHYMLKNEPRKDQKEELQIMLFSANNLLSIVNDILDFNKIEAGAIKFEYIETNMRDIAKNTVGGFKTFAEEKAIELHTHVDKDLDVTVLADPTRTSQVLTNLVHNAIKFTTKGSVTLSVTIDSRTEENIVLRFSVKDTGIGIPHDKQHIIFERFTQADSSTSRSFGGTGLGLSICKSILEKQGCTLHLESKEGEGTTFYFVQTFAICNKIIEEIPAPVLVKPTNSNKPLQGINILLVEDSEFNIIVATRFLQNWGAVIDVAQNGKEAIEKFDEERHKLILMDLHMPVMDGRDATLELRRKGTTVPIIALTASIYADENNKVLACGANDIVVKPFEPESLRNKLLQYLKIA